MRNSWRWAEVATASCCSSRRGEEVEDRFALGSADEMDGNGEEEHIVFAGKEVEMAVDVGKVKVDEVEKTGADRRESNIWLRWGMPMWRKDKVMKQKEMPLLEDGIRL